MVVAHSCREVLGSATTHRVAVLDINLGDGSGVDAARQLMDEGRVRHCVFMTGFAEPDVMAAAGKLGAVFMKGDGMHSLVERVNELANQ